MIGALAMLMGTLAALASPAVPSLPWLWVGALAAAGTWISPWRQARIAAPAAMMLGGLVLAWGQMLQWHTLRMPVAGADARTLIEGRVDSIPQADRGALRFDLLVGQRRYRLHWREARPAPRVGEHWRFLVRLSSSSDVRNLAGADVARLELRDRVHATGRVLPSAMNLPLRLAPASLDSVRARIASRIRDHVADREAAALLSALSVGLTGDMSDEQWRVFNATGTTHLVAISGLHVTLFAWLAFLVARASWRHVRCARVIEREPFALSSGLLAAGGYALLAGLTVPTQRTWLMLACYVLARLAWRQVSAARLWSVALVVVLLVDPLAPLSAGFWLSFVAVGVILLFAESGPPAPRWRDRAAALLRLQWALMLALAPLGFAVFGGMSLVGLLVNLVAIPVISLVFVPMVLAGALVAWLVPLACGPFFAAATWLHGALWPALTWCADLPLTYWRASPAAPWLLAAVPAVFVCLHRWPWPLRATGVCLLLPLLWSSPRAPPQGEAWVHVLDAGRGTAVVIRTRSQTLLFDTGDVWGTRGARLWNTLIPALDDAGVPRIHVILPTLDEDRARTAALLLLERDVERLTVGGGWPGDRLGTQPCRDSTFHRDGVEFRLLSAGPAGRYCLLRIAAAAGGTMLLPGDVDAAAERQVVDRLGAEALAVDAVMTSRRTSGTASSSRWIESTAPGLVIASGGDAGAATRAGVIERWRRSGAEVRDTRKEGGIELEIGAGVRIRATARQSRYPFIWRQAPVSS